MEDIKSAVQIAQEKLAELGEITPEERLMWKYLPEGQKLGARYLKEDLNLVAELNRYEEKVRQYIMSGAARVLTANISLPRDERARKQNKRLMEGLKVLKKGRFRAENAFTKMRRLFSHYQEQGEQQRQEAYQRAKEDFKTRFQQAVKQQMGAMASTNIDVERHPQFQDEWLHIKIRLDSEYLRVLEEYKRELESIE